MKDAVVIAPEVIIAQLEERILKLEGWLDFVTDRLNDANSKLGIYEKEGK
jgi:hypothetical protein